MQALQGIDGLLHDRKNFDRRVIWAKAPPVSLEQFEPEHALQLGDASGQCRLGDMHSFRRLGDVSRLADRDKGFQKPNIHDASRA
jgi:hypothetical protein